MESTGRNSEQNATNIKNCFELKLSKDNQYNETKIKHNKNSLALSKQFYGIIGGITAGIMGVQGINGFLLFFIFNLLGTLMTFFHIRNHFKSFFLNKLDIFLSDFFSGFI
ncbi:ER membrane protein complex subunit 6, putative, partial [Hepatocystis sp. ex Piliocolobus tephrosceles]